MKLIKLELISKNNKQRGTYLYTPIVKIENNFFWCKGLKVNRVLKRIDVDLNSLEIQREIPKEAYKANNLI